MKYLKKFEDMVEEDIFRNIDKTIEFINSGGDVNCICSEENDTPLHIAAFNGQIKVVRELIKHGANWNAKNDYGHDFLMYLDRGKIIDEFPEEYKKYLDKKEEEKYNI